MGAGDPDLAATVEALATAVDQLKAVHEGLLRYVGGTAAAFGELEPVDAKHEAASALLALAPQLSSVNAVVSVGELPVVDAQPDALRAIFLCLLSNALAFCGEPAPRVTITCDPAIREWRFAVRDEGIGIPTEDRERVFGAFIRLERGNGHGLGLGLTLARRLVELHGGRIWIDSEHRVGTTVHFTIPR